MAGESTMLKIDSGWGEEKTFDNIFEIFPQEIWEIIVEQIEDSQDWLNLYRTSPQFEDFMGKNKITALFPEVIRHVVSKLNYRDALNCRLVSKPFKTAVDTINDKNIKDVSIFNKGSEYPYFSLSRTFDGYAIDRFYNDMKNHIGSPFVGGELSISFSKYVEHGFDDFHELLGQFGKYVEIYHIFYETGIDEKNEYFLGLIKCDLPYMPNLKILRVEDEHETRSFCNDEDEDISWLKKISFPKVPKLKLLQFSDHRGWKYASKFLLDLFPSPEKVTKVNILYLVDNFPQMFPNVEDLTVCLSEEEEIETMEDSRWELKSLRIEGSITFGGLFDNCSFMLATFGSTLKNLYICRLWADKETQLKLPNLTNLNIRNFRGCMNFLKGVKSLSILKIQGMDELKENEKIEVFGSEKIYRSDIWKVLPKLESFILRAHNFSRYLYEQQETSDSDN